MIKRVFLSIIVIIAIGFLTYKGLETRWPKLFSPGQLSAAHAKLDLSGDCQACHTKGKQVDNGKCLGCHKEIKERRDSGSGLHSLASEECLVCHSEHHGLESNIAYFDHHNFDHSRAGWELEGIHDRLKCEVCHKKDSYLMDKKNCIDCHQDIHEGENGDDCAECHSQDTFKME